MTLKMVARTGHPDFLDLPRHAPLEGWESDRLVEVPRGISRHVVRFVDYGGALYALKELPAWLAEREYRLLRRLADESIPVVEVVGVVDRALPGGRSSHDGDSVLITRHLDFSLPYRTLIARGGIRDLGDRLLDALAELLVRLHLAGFYWGDCSLSNTLFRRDAGRLAAYLVDAETGEMHPRLSEGQRAYDLQLAEFNLAGELMDLQAAGELPEGLDPLEMSGEIRHRYERLWSELTREEVFGASERYRIEARLRRLNELGFDVRELELVACEGGYRLRVHTHVVEPGHHRRRLLMLTGLDVQENQARRLLHDIAGFRAHLERRTGEALPEAVAAARWLVGVFQPTIERIPPEALRSAGLEPAEAFHEILEHRWFRSEEQGRDVGLDDAVDSYVQEQLGDAAAGTARSRRSSDEGTFDQASS
ncbi:MAG: DUF4032 domain-containing protein [Actinomycetota bacterium]